MGFRHYYRALGAALLLSQPVHAQLGKVPSAPPSGPNTSPSAASPSAASPSAASPSPVAGGSGYARVGLSLEQAVSRFRRENLKIVAAAYEVGAARADIIAAGLLPNPTLSLTGGFHVHGVSDSAERQYSILLSQAVPLWGRIGASKEAARLTASAAERNFAAAGWELLGDLRRAYLALQLAEQRRVVLSLGLGDLERVQQVLEARTAAGANPAYDRLRLEVERGSLRARIAQAEVETAEARSQLAAAIGGPASQEELVASDGLAEPASDGRETSALVRRALEHRQEVGATHLEAGAAEARVRAVRRRFLPEPELGIGYSRWTGIPGAASGSSGGALLASAALPLPVFDRGQGTIQRQLEQSRVARVRERDLKRQIVREVERAAHILHLTSSAYLAYRAETAHNVQTVRRVAELTYREGRGTILELLDAYSSYLRVEEQDLELRGAALAAAVDLEQAIGP